MARRLANPLISLARALATPRHDREGYDALPWSPKVIREMMTILKREGWDPKRHAKVTVRRDGTLFVDEGNHRLAAARRIGLRHIPVEYYTPDGRATTRRNPGPPRKASSRPTKAYMDAFAKERNRIRGEYSLSDYGKWGTWGKGGYSYNNSLLPLYHGGATPEEAARWVEIQRGAGSYWQWRAETAPLVAGLDDDRAWIYAIENARSLRKSPSSTISKARRDESHHDYYLQGLRLKRRREDAEAAHAEYYEGVGKISAFLRSVIPITKAEADALAAEAAEKAAEREKREAPMRAFLEASRRERAEEMGPSVDPFRDPDDREAARRRASTLEINPRRRRPARRELRLGLREEREHDDVTGGDPRLVRRIALAHLREDPRYYTKLARCFRKNPLSSLILKQVPGGFASGEVTTWPEFRRSMEGSAFDHELDRAGRFVAGRKKVLDLKFLEVDRDRRGTGIGRRLATAVERAGRRRGARASLLVASRVDERAKHPAAFWKRMGYKRFSGASRGDGLFAKLMNGRRRRRRARRRA